MAEDGQHGLTRLILSQRDEKALVANAFGEEATITTGGKAVSRSDARMLPLDTRPGQACILTPTSRTASRLEMHGRVLTATCFDVPG